MERSVVTCLNPDLPPDDVLIVGAGQGGLSVSWFLTQAGITHRVLDRGGVAHSWKKHRWDSFCLVTPNWSINLPGHPYIGDDPNGFMPRDEFVAYMQAWAHDFGAPVETNTDVHRITPNADGFRVETNRGPRQARSVVVATATYQKPRLPSLAADLPPNILQIHAEDYKSPDQARPGAVLVVGSGQTGCQVVEDFVRAGRDVYLCVSRTGRLPRRYRGRDCIEWQRDMGLLDRAPDMLDAPADRFIGDPHLTGRDGGSTVSIRGFEDRGVTLLGRLASVEGQHLRFASDLAQNLAHADHFAAQVRANIDAYIERTGRDAPPSSPGEMSDVPNPYRPTRPAVADIDLDAAEISTVIWATGFTFDFSWIDGLPVDAQRYPLTDGGQSPMLGLYFCGLNWMTRRKSGILYGVAEDAEEVATRIARHHSDAACARSANDKA
jgi:putative flavoprotein involved in K+ transport